MLIIKPEGGLCNKLRTISASLSLAREIGCKLRIVWWIGKYQGINTYFTDLFEKPSEFELREYSEGSIIPRLMFDRRFPWVYTTTGKRNVELMSKKARACAGRGLIVGSLWADFMGNPDYSWLHLTDEMSKLVKSIKSELLDGSEYVGLHIRRTDNTVAIKHSPLYLFEDAITKELSDNPHERFFLASDDEPTKEHLKAKFGECIRTRKVSTRQEFNGVRDAVIDFMLLAGSKRLYGSYKSSFSGGGGKLIELDAFK